MATINDLNTSITLMPRAEVENLIHKLRESRRIKKTTRISASRTSAPKKPKDILTSLNVAQKAQLLAFLKESLDEN